MAERIFVFIGITVACGIVSSLSPKEKFNGIVSFTVSIISVLMLMSLFGAVFDGIDGADVRSEPYSYEREDLDSAELAVEIEVRRLCKEYTGVYPENVEAVCYRNGDAFIIDSVKIYVDESPGLLEKLKKDLTFENIFYGDLNESFE